jgi:hypothetical protein
LALTKEFAKRNLYSPLSAIPHEIARVLYFASIGVALSRCGQRITTLKDEEIVAGLTWALSQDWLAEDARQVIASSLQAITSSGMQST